MVFTITNRQRIFDELQIDAGGEKPERQQHIHSEHVQKLHSCTRGVAILKNVTRTEGATHKKNERHGRRERYLCVSTHPLDENGRMTEKCTLVLAWHTIALRNPRTRKRESSPRVGRRAMRIVYVWNVENQASRTRGVETVENINGALG